jgi:hypothetical protein
VVGKSYPRTVRLAEIAIGCWDSIDGTYTAQTGLNLLHLPTHRLLNVVYVWALEHREDPQAWVDGLDTPFGQDPRVVPDEEFDDSYDQINQ